MLNKQIKPGNIVKNYWNGNMNKGFDISIIKEKKIDIINGCKINSNNNAKET